ncbi:hypothetical protein LTR65_006880 [Meristemomyces frigidus]
MGDIGICDRTVRRNIDNLALQGATYTLWRRALYIVGGAQFLINTIEVALILNQCTPTEKLWDQSVPGTCDLITVCSKVGFLQGSIGAFSDLFLALYPPAVIIGPLQAMALRTKVILCIIMGGGVVAGIAGIVKTIEIESITHTSDISYATLNLLILVLTEMWFIIIFGSLPTLRPVFVATAGNIKSLTGRSKRTKAQSSQDGDNSWVELSAKGFHAKIDGGKKRIHDPYGCSDSEEMILGTTGEIMVTQETTVRTSPL